MSAARVDPAEYGRRKAEAMARAKELKFNRNNAPDDNLTFKPKLVAKPGYLDSLDVQASKIRVNVIKDQLNSGDVFEKPLPATLHKAKINIGGGYQQEQPHASIPFNAPSPGSDALGKMMKAQQSSSSSSRPAVPRVANKASPPKPRARDSSQFEAAYIPSQVEPLGISSRKDRISATEVQNQFQASLRPERTGDNGTEIDSARVAPRRRPSVPTLSTSAAAAAAAAASAASRERLTTPTKPPLHTSASHTPPNTRPKTSPGKLSGGGGQGVPFASPRTAVIVKSRLSLLKSKIRKSESAVVTGLATGAASRAPNGMLSRSSTAPYSPETSPLRSATATESSGRPQSGRNSVSRTASAPPAAVSSSSSYPAAKFSNPDPPEEFGNPGSPQQQQQCEQCGRLFNPAPYARHIKICAKVFIEKRKVFDTKEKRIGDNPELVALERKKAEPGRNRKANEAAAAAAAAEAEIAEAKKKKLWKEQSGAFRQAMKAAREVTKAINEGGPMPEFKPSAPDPSMLQCPTCGRRFSQKAGERHIPQCKDIKAKPSRLVKGGGLGGGVQGTIVNEKQSGHAALSKPPPPTKRASSKR